MMVFVSWRQLASADDVSVYCQPHLSASERLSAMSDTLWSAMYHFDAKPESLSTHSAICVLSWFHVKSRLRYSIVVPPTTLLAQATINTIPTNETAFVKVDLALDKTEVMLSHQQVQLLHIQMYTDRISFASILSSSQYIKLLQVSESLSFLRRREVFAELRPTTSVKEKASSWWRFAAKCVTNEKIIPWTWRHMKQHRFVCKN